MSADSAMRGSILGTRVQRTEDPELLNGHGRYVADLPLEGRLHAVFVGSDVAHGLVRTIHTDEAAQQPGVAAVWTAAELDMPPHHGAVPVHDDFARPPLATDRVRFVGEPLAVVFAESHAQALDAAELVWADIDPLPVFIDPEASLAADAEPVFPEHGSNVALSIPDATQLDLDEASDVVVRGRYVNQRMAVAPMEPDSVAAAPEEDGRIRVWPSTQMPHGLHRTLAKALGWDRSELRITTPRVGGGFGGKAGIRPEYTVVTAAARALGALLTDPWVVG